MSSGIIIIIKKKNDCSGSTVSLETGYFGLPNLLLVFLPFGWDEGKRTIISDVISVILDGCIVG